MGDGKITSIANTVGMPHAQDPLGLSRTEFDTDAAPCYNTVNLALTSKYKLGAGTFKPVLRVDNVADKQYAGSVNVNDGNGRFFEPAAPRTVYVGVSRARP